PPLQIRAGTRSRSLVVLLTLFFFSSRRRHTRSKRDWSSDVCSSDLKVAKDILKGAKEDLVRLVEAAYRQMPDTSSQTLVVSGGVFQNRLFRESFEAEIRERLNGLTLIYPKLSPVIGALTLALKQAGIQLTDDVKKTLEHYRIDSNKGGMNSSGSA